ASLEYNLFTMRFELRNVSVRARHAPDLPPLFTADRVWAVVSPRKYRVDDAVIENPQVAVVIAVDGTDNIPNPPRKSGSQTVDYLVRRLLVSAGSVRFEHRGQRINAWLPLERILVEGDAANGNHRATVQARDGQFAGQGQTLPIRGFSANVVVGKI